MPIPAFETLTEAPETSTMKAGESWLPPGEGRFGGIGVPGVVDSCKNGVSPADGPFITGNPEVWEMGSGLEG